MLVVKWMGSSWLQQGNETKEKMQSVDTRFSPVLIQIVLIFKKLCILIAALEDDVGYVQ